MKLNLKEMAEVLVDEFGFIIKKDEMYFAIDRDLHKFRDRVRDLVYPHIPETHIVQGPELAQIILDVLYFMQLEMQDRINNYNLTYDNAEQEYTTICEDTLPKGEIKD